ncbi:hypothetical protein PFLUV_G00267980 [Perca fluviatilis]|uniref:Uncharacterized protein n=1 Tax=Perca fluviatilis TaxID=8168 RepID=A0A6A5DN26_PERFL|nr:hypothetical protein PFLUV_G00267980 [Perca fluviatilis]
MFRSIFGLKLFTRPRSSRDMDSSTKKSKRRSERPSSPEDLNPPTILREHRRRGERPSSSGGTNPSTIMKDHRERGEGPLSCGENQPSTTRQQERRDVTSLFIVGTNPSTIMKERRGKGESPLSCAEHKPSTTRQHVRRGESPSSSSTEDKQPSTSRRQQAWRGESPSSSSSEDDQCSTTRQRVRRFESPSSSSSEDEQLSTPRWQQAWRGESPSLSSSEDDQPSTTRLLVRRDVSSLFIVGTNPSTITKERRQRGKGPLSCAENQPSTTRQQVRRFESPSSSSSEDDQRSTTRQQERRAESLEEEGLKRERERCEEMKRKNEEKERKTFSLRSRMYIWWLSCKIDNIARDIQSTFMDESYLLRLNLRNPEKMAEKERLHDLRRELVLYKRRQEFKLEREVRKQRLKAMERRRKDINLPTTFRQNGGIGENHLPCIDIDQPTIWWEHVRRGERPLPRGDFNPPNTLRPDGQSGDSPSSTSSSSEDDEASTTRRQQERRANSPLSIYLGARKEREFIEREKQRLEEESLKRERERCEEMKRKNEEKERKTFSLRSRMYIWWLNCKIDRIARDIQSTFMDESYRMLHDLRNPEKMAEKERLIHRRRELIVYKRRQEFKLEREVRKQRLKAMERRRKGESPLSCAKNKPNTYPNLALVRFWQRP